MAKRKTLPKDFEQLVQTASDEDIKRYWANATSMHMADTTREMHWNFHFQRR